MKEHLGLLTAVCMAGLTAFVGYSSFSRPTDPRMADEVADTVAFAVPTESQPSMRDALNPAPSPMPIPIAGYVLAPKAAPAAAPAPRLPPGAELKARRHPTFSALLDRPAGFVMRRTVLGKPTQLKRFLADPKAVDAYLDSPLVRAALRHPSVAKAVVGNGRLVRAFLGSPALQDPAAARALLKSRLVRKILDCPGVQEAVSDPSVMMRLAADPETMEFVTRHPQALKVLGEALPALAQALGA